jgi:hypothetical protein
LCVGGGVEGEERNMWGWRVYSRGVW